MPIYEYRCRTCDVVYEERRSMAEADEPVTCPSGHQGSIRLLPVFATIGAGESPGSFACAPSAMSRQGMGGCAGQCACH